MSEQRGAKEAEHGDDYVNTVLFTALTALLMTYLKRAAATMLAVEQWRIWVFLFLNIVLLAIVFSSICNNNNNNNKNESSSEQNRERRDKDSTAAEEEAESKPEKKEEAEEQCRWFETTNQVAEQRLDQESGKNCEEAVIEAELELELELEPEPEPEPARLSKEELNERAEAFIVMFRQHLVLDAMNGRSNHRRDSIQLSKHSQVQLLQVRG